MIGSKDDEGKAFNREGRWDKQVQTFVMIVNIVNIMNIMNIVNIAKIVKERHSIERKGQQVQTEGVWLTLLTSSDAF